MNHGNLVAQAPIEDLLAGSEGIAYTLILDGNTKQAYTRLSAKPWVVSISEKREKERTHWVVNVSDDAMAKKQLLRAVLADDDVDVIDFGLKQYELEEIFMRLVEGSNND